MMTNILTSFNFTAGVLCIIDFSQLSAIRLILVHFVPVNIMSTLWSI